MEQTSDKKLTRVSEDALLIRNILDGHPEQFRVLADRYGQQVMELVGRIIPQAEDVEEAVQDTLMETYQSLQRFDSQKANFRTWLLRIAYHTALKRLRDKSHMQFVDVEPMQLEAIADPSIDALLSDTTPDRLALLEQAIHQLAPPDQMLLSLY
ncbi:MAG: sigma-70 family RNA polymerase sigma factor [Bacteroidaceae bacterium]|nr:sigma-70 family RNA polymerase sigma factor [Bacteroidaceae bacterium]